MATIVDRDLAVRLLTEEFAALDELYSALTDDQWALATTLPGWTGGWDCAAASARAAASASVSLLAPCSSSVDEASFIWRFSSDAKPVPALSGSDWAATS